MAYEVELSKLPPEYNSDLCRLGARITSEVSRRGQATIVFLPGLNEIEEFAEALNRAWDEKPQNQSAQDLDILVLHSATMVDSRKHASGEEIDKGKARIILATNIAESSLTLRTVAFVIDFGVQRQSVRHSLDGIIDLTTVPISTSAHLQRRGRTGREIKGVCISMFTKPAYEALAKLNVEPMTEQSLAQAYLIALGWAGSEAVQTVDQILLELWQPPPQDMVAKVALNLESMGVIKADSSDIMTLTRTGQVLSQIPLEIHVGRFLLASIAHDCLAEGVLVSAVISAVSSASGLYKSTHEMSSLSDLERWKLFLGIYSSRVHFDEGFGVPSYQLESL